MTEVADMISQIMDDGVKGMDRNYRDLISEAFISPIRSAVVVDDEFPTLDEFLNDRVAAEKKPHANRAKEIIQFCRARSPFPWIVDVHDGRNITIDSEVLSATHFDHTDLLVLDYHLKGIDEGGDLAIHLLRKLARNEHFNLVIVYTNNDIPDTVREIGVGLSSKACYESFYGATEDLHIRKVIEQWEGTRPNILRELSDSIDRIAVIKAHAAGLEGFARFAENDDFSAFLEILSQAPVRNFNPKNVLKYVLRKKFLLIKEFMAETNFGMVHLDDGIDADGKQVNWIRVDSLFVTVIKKSDVNPNQFDEYLVNAIQAWDPSPHRLILSRMRGEMSRRGVIVEKEVLQNPYLQAAWLKDIFNREKSEVRTSVRRNVTRHWESLGSKIELSVLDFAERVSDYLLAHNVQASKYSSPHVLSDAKKMALHVNNYVCSKPVDGHHLLTGHVFKLGADEYWVCLTPACDLEPRGETGGVNKNLGMWKPFKAAQIIPMSDGTAALDNATRGNHLFLSIGGQEPTAFTFASSVSVEQSSAPTLRWQQFYAANQGIFSDEKSTFKVAISSDVEGSLQFLESKAKVVAHVRYEYALHLLHRLGSHLSRVGLDYINPVSSD